MPLSQPNKHRLTAVLNHERPDRLPHFEVLVENPTFSHVMERTMPWPHTLANIDPDAYIEFARRIGQDVVGLCFYSSPFRQRNAEGELGPVYGRITCADDLRQLEVVGIESLDAHFALLDRYVTALRGTDIGLFVLLGSFFTDTYDSLFGFENFMCQLYDNRALIEWVLERYQQYYVALATRLAQYDLTFIYFGDDIAYKGGTLINPDSLRELWVPRMRAMMAPAAARGIPIVFHSDGNIEALLPDLIEMGVKAINPVEPYAMDIRQIKQRYGRELTLIGNLDVGGALSQGTPDDVRRDATALIETVGRDGGLILASCHSITANVKPENFLAMVRTAQAYKY